MHAPAVLLYPSGSVIELPTCLNKPSRGHRSQVFGGRKFFRATQFSSSVEDSEPLLVSGLHDAFVPIGIHRSACRRTGRNVWKTTMVPEGFVSSLIRERFKFSRSRRCLLNSVGQAYRAVRWSFGSCSLCFSRSCNESKMSSSWRLLEATPDLLEQFSESLISFEDLTESLEKKGLLSGDIVDHAEISSRTESATDIRELVKRIVMKDEDSFKCFRRTLIENGEYNALQVLSGLSLEHEHHQQQPQQLHQQDHTLEPHPQLTGIEQMPPRDQSDWSSSLPRSVCVSPPGTGLPTRTEDSAQQEEVDAKPAMGEASTSSASLSSMVTVTKAKQIAHGPRIYTLSNSPRGLCVIFNNRNFPNIRERDRPGSELDVQRMKMLFEEFKFTVITHIDQTSHEMLSLLDTHANQTVVEGHQAFVLILMSHGELNHIYGNDYTQVKLQDIFEKFNNLNCPALRERPKMFFIQACRGDQCDNGAPGRDPIADYFDDDGVQSDAGVFLNRTCSSLDGVEQPIERRISYWSDMYIAYAVVEGFESLRDSKSGSWFMKAVFDVMARYAHKDDLDTLMDSVSQRVLEKQRVDGQRQCPEVKKIGWRKKLYFNPGLSD